MSTVKISPKYQVVIPKSVRKSMAIKPGQEVEVLRFENRIELVPIKPMSEMRGFIRGTDNTFSRSEDRTL